jgi:hypothetical protein
MKFYQAATDSYPSLTEISRTTKGLKKSAKAARQDFSRARRFELTATMWVC